MVRSSLFDSQFLLCIWFAAIEFSRIRSVKKKTTALRKSCRANRKKKKRKQSDGGEIWDMHAGSTYLNAAAQTTVPWPAARTKTEERSLKVTRETQKSWMRNCNKQTVKEAFTQMKKNGASIDDFCDVELLPGPYMDSAEWEARRHAAATLIQRYVRRSIAKRTADRIRLYAKEKREVQCLSKAVWVSLSLSLFAFLFCNRSASITHFSLLLSAGLRCSVMFLMHLCLVGLFVSSIFVVLCDLCITHLCLVRSRCITHFCLA
jgi:hypothetical protein